MEIRPGPNDVIACPSPSCARWHLAHGYDHRCGRSIPAFRRRVALVQQERRTAI